jgi:hypothetical protein
MPNAKLILNPDAYHGSRQPSVGELVHLRNGCRGDAEFGIPVDEIATRARPL